MGDLMDCGLCETPKPEEGFDECAACKTFACEECTSFAELPGYPLCENCALAREEKEHASATAPPRSAPELPPSEEVS